MTRTQSALACAAAIASAWLLAPDPSAAQEDDLAAQRDALEGAVERRTEGNAEAAEVQDRIDAISDETDSLVAQYRTTLKQIDSIRIYNGQMRDLISSQKAELASLADQLGRVELVGRSVTPLMLRMIDALEQFVALDVPFLLEERTKRVETLRETMARADVTNAEKYRQIMEAYAVENEYGRTIEAYRATIDIDGRETTVDFLRFGRIALVYQSLDETERGVWNQEKRSWQKLDSSYRSAIRNGLRIARKQAAPDLIRLPLPAAHDARETS
jgi:septal ring factor EnvC (AmiA/AmiB activator)